jgi:hypothetical protein
MEGDDGLPLLWGQRSAVRARRRTPQASDPGPLGISFPVSEAIQQQPGAIPCPVKTIHKFAIAHELRTYPEHVRRQRRSKPLSHRGRVHAHGLPVFEGATEIRAAYAGIFGMIRLKIAFAIEEIEVDRDTAMAVTSSKGAVTILAKGIEAPESNRELFVLRRQNGAWKIYRYMFNKTSSQSN